MHHRLRPLASSLALCCILLAGCSDNGDTASQGTDTAATAPAPAPASASDELSYGNVTYERLKNADSEPGNWFTGGRDQGQSYYSPLTQINKENVSRLGLAWDYDMFTNRGQEATPIVVDGVMYTSGTRGKVYALNAKTGDEIWFFDPEADGQYARYNCCGEVNRGVAVFDGMVYVATMDGRMIGLDAATGDKIWDVNTLIFPDRAANISGAPQVAGDVVVIGNGGAELDARGYVSAYDLKTGELKWRFFTVPRDPKLGEEHEELDMAVKTWDPNSRWDVGGGGTVWNGMAYDPDLNLLYIGTGNAALYNWHERSPSGGDNLFLASIIAINPDTGRMVWYHQQVPEERWDYTAVQPMILTDMEFDGEMKKVLMQAPKNGFFYIYDRATGQLLSADKYVPANWAKSVDLKTGRPVIDTEAADYKDEPKFVYPSSMGGHNWQPMSYDPKTGLVYIPAMEAGMIIGDLTEGHDYKPKQWNTGTSTLFGPPLMGDIDSVPPVFRNAMKVAKASDQAPGRFVLKAFDPRTGETVWQHASPVIQERAGVMSTASGLVFKGADSGNFRAYDAETGKLLLDIQTGSSIMAAPMTYMVDGVQYVAVQTGYGGGGWNVTMPNSAIVKYGNENRILVFKLDGGPVPLPPEVPPLPPIPEPPAQTASAETISHGKELFSVCSVCHSNMDYSLAPDLRRMTAQTHADFKDIVLDGARRDRGMPQWDDVLSEEDVEAIHAYLIDLEWTAYTAQEEGKDVQKPVTPTEHSVH